MQGGWLLVAAVGNKFLFVGSLMWKRVDLYMLWGIFIICCILSAVFVFFIMKRLEKATNSFLISHFKSVGGYNLDILRLA